MHKALTVRKSCLSSLSLKRTLCPDLLLRTVALRKQRNCQDRQIIARRMAADMVPDTHTRSLQFGSRVFSGSFSPNGRYLLTASQDFSIRIYDVNRLDTEKRAGNQPEVNRYYLPGLSVLKIQYFCFIFLRFFIKFSLGRFRNFPENIYNLKIWTT